MIDPVELSARATAHRMSEEHGQRLSADVEMALHMRSTKRSEQYIDPVSLGGLIVSIATLTWTVYTDLHKTTPRPPPEVVARTVRVRLQNGRNVNSALQDRIIDVVVDETVKAAKEQDSRMC